MGSQTGTGVEEAKQRGEIGKGEDKEVRLEQKDVEGRKGSWEREEEGKCEIVHWNSDLAAVFLGKAFVLGTAGDVVSVSPIDL